MLIAILYVARAVIITFAFAILLAYLIDPVVRFLQSHSLFFRNLRGPHVLEAYLAFLLCLVFVGHAIAPRLISFNSKLLKTAPTLIEGLSTGEIAETIGQKYHWDYGQESQLRQFLVRPSRLDSETCAERGAVHLQCRGRIRRCPGPVDFLFGGG